MSKERIRVNVRSLANTSAARKEKRNGRDVMIVPSATLPDNIVMNDIMYPADEIEASYTTLNRSPAPCGHPTINGRFVSARDPEGINIGWVGAWNENARRENGRVFLDKVIDIERANQTEKGKAVLDAIEKGEPVHTSTGLLCTLVAANGDVDYSHTATDIIFDHDAILLDEEGAATPEQGVGMFVNTKAVNDGEEIRVVNSVLEDAERDLDWAVDMAVRAVERMEQKPMFDQIKAAIKEMFKGRKTETNQKENEMPITDEQFNGLSADVKALTEAMKPLANLNDTIKATVDEAIKPINDHVNEIANSQKAAEDSKRAEAVNKLVKSGQWSEDELTDTPLAVLEKMVANSKPGKAQGLNSAFNNSNSQEDEFADYTINQFIEGEK